MPATDDVAGVFAEGRTLLLGDAEGRPFEPTVGMEIAGAREFKGGLIVRFAGVRDRDTAGVLRGRTLLMPAAEARPLEDDEYFLHDLVGLEVFTVAGERVGRVTELYETGPGHYLGIADGERERLVPFIQAIVREVDVKGGRIVIDPPPGLLDA